MKSCQIIFFSFFSNDNLISIFGPDDHERKVLPSTNYLVFPQQKFLFKLSFDFLRLTFFVLVSLLLFHVCVVYFVVASCFFTYLYVYFLLFTYWVLSWLFLLLFFNDLCVFNFFSMFVCLSVCFCFLFVTLLFLFNLRFLWPDFCWFREEK